MKRAAFLKGVGALVLAPAVGRAQGAWPDKQIRMVIPFAAGGTTDLLARALGQHMTQAWGQPVVADNRAGANGVVAGEGTTTATPLTLDHALRNAHQTTQDTQRQAPRTLTATTPDPVQD